MSRPFASANVFSAIAHETRRDIVLALRQGEVSAGELCKHAGCTQPTLSAHLGVLRETGIVSSRRKGVKVFYKLNRAAFAPIEQFIRSVQAKA